MDEAGGDVAQLDEFAGFADPGLGGVVVDPLDARPALDPTEILVVAQGVERDHVGGVGGGHQACREHRGLGHRHVRGRRGQAASGGAGRVDDLGELVPDQGGAVAGGVGGHPQRGRSVLAVADAEGAQHPVGVVDEVAVDRHRHVARLRVVDRRVGGQRDLVHVEPLRRRRGVGSVFAFAEQQDVGHHGRAGDGGEGRIRQPHPAEEIGRGRHRRPRPGVEGVHGVAAGDDRDVATGCGEREAFQDEVVVDGMPIRVVRRVVDGKVAERHVADGGDERVLRDAGGFEALTADLRVGVERRGDPRRSRGRPRHRP